LKRKINGIEGGAFKNMFEGLEDLISNEVKRELYDMSWKIAEDVIARTLRITAKTVQSFVSNVHRIVKRDLSKGEIREVVHLPRSEIRITTSDREVRIEARFYYTDDDFEEIRREAYEFLLKRRVDTAIRIKALVEKSDSGEGGLDELIPDMYRDPRKGVGKAGGGRDEARDKQEGFTTEDSGEGFGGG
jgi:hypothetical protein